MHETASSKLQSTVSLLMMADGGGVGCAGGGCEGCGQGYRQRCARCRWRLVARQFEAKAAIIIIHPSLHTRSRDLTSVARVRT